MACKVVRNGWCQDCLLKLWEIRIDTDSTPKFDVFVIYVNLKIILCYLVLEYLLLIAIVCCYKIVCNACWLLSFAYYAGPPKLGQCQALVGMQ